MDSIIFDVDGTLWDSTEICAKAWTDVIHRETSLSLTINASTLKGLFGRLLPDIASVLLRIIQKKNSFVSSIGAVRKNIKLCWRSVHRCIRILKNTATIKRKLSTVHCQQLPGRLYRSLFGNQWSWFLL